MIETGSGLDVGGFDLYSFPRGWENELDGGHLLDHGLGELCRSVDD